VAKPYKRTRLWVDPAFQCRLLVRIVVYWALVMVVWIHIAYAVERTVGFVEKMSSGAAVEGVSYTDFLWRQRFLLAGLVLALPAVLYDLLKFSHRIAGPLYRCRRAMQDMADGKPVAEFKPRKHDLLGELWPVFNALIRTCNARAEADAVESASSAITAVAPPARVRDGTPEPQEVHS
jgi:hypothetical protein